MKILFLSLASSVFIFCAAPGKTCAQSRQNERSEQIENRWGAGGSLGFAVGRNSFGFQLSPQVTYLVEENLVAGGGISYSHIRTRGQFKSSLNYFGINGTVRFFPIDNIFVFVQPEVWNRWGKSGDVRIGHEVFMALPLGAGFTLPSGPGEIQIALYYDVVQNKYSPYNNGIGMSIGYIFRF